jgi:glutathione S-transferase
MKLYYDPLSTTSRPLMMFAAEHRLPIEWELVSLLQEEHRAAEFLIINPNGCVPVMVDGGFVLTECSAILKYLAELADSPAYPKPLRERAQVHAAMDWFITNCHAAIGPGLVYPKLYPDLFPMAPEVLAAITASGLERCIRWLNVLDRHMIGRERNYVVGDALTIADYLGGSVVSLLDGIDFDLSHYPNVRRWLSGLKARPNWGPTFAAFNGLLSALKPAA